MAITVLKWIQALKGSDKLVNLNCWNKMSESKIRTLLRNSLYPFGVLSEGIDEIIHNDIAKRLLPKRIKDILWWIDLRAGNLHRRHTLYD